MVFKDQPSRIIGLITVLLLLVTCSSIQSSEPDSLPPADSPLPFTPKFTTFPHTQTAVLPTPTSTAFPPSQPQIDVIRDIPYSSQLKPDVYKPSEPGPWPVVVAFHGGDMIKKRFNVFSKRIAELGAEVLTPTWRSGRPKGEQITSDQITAGWEDAACVLGFARAKAADYDGDLSRW